ncbi:hypothetical protein [Halorubrum ezzemoulense]|uniref:hypothetical protein n=1 Tax=Halorubrum ezzemoulense TaxID=337243 RepID=UPI00232DCD8D|nr:hypothetical protein [Halorubrum ezzemoulense]MDB2249248.1 hypothetical protein [Halorubrum ezzemoulense]
MAIQEYAPGAFTGPLKAQVGVELKEGRPRFENKPRKTVWFGIELTEEGETLANLEGKFNKTD